MNRRSFFQRTAGLLVGATVAPQVVAAAPVPQWVELSAAGTAYGGDIECVLSMHAQTLGMQARLQAETMAAQVFSAYE